MKIKARAEDYAARISWNAIERWQRALIVKAFLAGYRASKRDAKVSQTPKAKGGE